MAKEIVKEIIKEKCTRCGGTGRVRDGKAYITCPNCGGKGYK